MAGGERKRRRIVGGPSGERDALSDEESSSATVVNGEEIVEELVRSDAEEMNEDDHLASEEERDEEEEDGEDLLNDAMMEDYRPVEALDHYEVDSQAEAETGSLSIGARRAAENAMRERDGVEHSAWAGERRLPAALRAQVDGDDEGDDENHFRRRRRLAEAAAASQSKSGGGDRISGMPDEYDDGTFDLENHRGPLREWIVMDRPKRELRKRFASFLRETKDGKTGSLVYMELIRHMCANNKQSLVVSYRHLSSADPLLAVWVADAPAEMLDIFNGVARETTLMSFPTYGKIHPDIYVRIADLPIVDNLRDIRHIHLNCLVKVGGVVTRRTGVFPHMKVVKLDCQRCGTTLVPSATVQARPEKSISQCTECGSRGPFTVNSEQTIFGNFQRLTIQESPGSVPAGRIPRQKDVLIAADLIDCARPGDEVEVTGIYRHTHDVNLNLKNGFPVFSTVIEANYVRKMEDALSKDELTDDEVAQLRKLSQDPQIFERIVASIAPSIYGHKDIKTGIAMSLFGGEAKEVGEKHRIRGDINILLLGDPGTAKSQFLKYVEKTAHRSVYTTGKGASAVGLTAAVRKDPVSREWVLEGGALVIADRGTCMIDEFDKMNDQDRTSIHEAMEQQTISISKAGIVTSLQARCSIIAAANPIKGRYDSSVSFFENVDLTEPILSRFDILCVVRDTVDPLVDETLARFVVNSHMASHPSEGRNASQDHGDMAAMVESESNIEPIPQEILRKYIIYARKNVNPRLTNVDNEKISRLYIDLRRESISSGGMPIALRHLESIVRMSEAHARMHLRNYVRDNDVNAAISVVLESFFQSQKFSVMRGLKRKFYKYITYRKNNEELLFYLLSRLVRDYLTAQGSTDFATSSSSSNDGDAPVSVQIDIEDFNARARELGISSTQDFINSSAFEERGFSIDQIRNRIIKQL